jgi:membrane associated rhomboid family serine protease
VGASGAVMALLACNALLFPNQQYQYFGGYTLDATQMLATNLAMGASTALLGASSVMEKKEWSWWAHTGGGNALAFNQPT